MEWLIVEIAIFGFFLMTMLLTMFKSRFWKVGMDNSGQFEDTNMSYLCNRIIKNIDFSISQDPRAFYIDKERLVQVQGVMIKLCLPKEDFDKIYNNRRYEVPQEESIAWIKRCVVGNISKKELDNERMKETNSLDMMQNSSIVYHTESILEMQIACLISVYYLTQKWA